MERRDLLRALASAAALSVVPREQALAAWSRVAETKLLPPPTNGLNDAQLALVRAVADTILPRTDTPSATDVGVERFVNVIVAEHLSDEERAKGMAGLDAIDAKAREIGSAVFAALPPETRGKVIEALESGSRDTEPSQTYWRLKSLIIHGYFTSEPVMKDVLKTRIMFPAFQGSAPVKIKKRPVQAGTVNPSHEEHLHG